MSFNREALDKLGSSHITGTTSSAEGPAADTAETWVKL